MSLKLLRLFLDLLDRPIKADQSFLLLLLVKYGRNLVCGLPSSFPLSALLYSAQLCSCFCPALALLLGSFWPATGLLLACSLSCPGVRVPQFGSRHLQHLFWPRREQPFVVNRGARMLNNISQSNIVSPVRVSQNP